MQYGCQKLWPDLDWFWLAAAWWGYKKCASSSVQKWRRHDVQMLAASILGFIDRDRPNIPLQSFLKGALSTSHTRCCFLGMPTIQEWQCPSYRYPLLCFNILTEYLKNLAFFNSFVEDEFNIICQYLEHLEHIFPWFSMPCLPTPTSGPPQTSQASKPGLPPLRCMAWSRQAAFSKRRCW